MRRAVSLVEVLIALVVAAFFLGVLFSSLIWTSVATTSTLQEIVAVDLARELVDVVRGLGYGRVRSTAGAVRGEDALAAFLGCDLHYFGPDGEYERSLEVSPSAAGSPVKTVTVRVAWTKKGATSGGRREVALGLLLCEERED